MLETQRQKLKSILKEKKSHFQRKTSKIDSFHLNKTERMVKNNIMMFLKSGKEINTNVELYTQ